MGLPTKDGAEYGLVGQFREFHAELLRVRYALEVGGRLAGRGDGDVDPAELAGRVHYRLRALLERQAVDALRHGGSYGSEIFRKAQYLMAALADETLLHRLEWDGRDLWTDHLVETALFGTQIAGERIFDELDAIMGDGTGIHPELATIYLATLSLGFRGRLWRPEHAAQLRRYRQGLARVMARHDPELARREAGRLFPGAYDATLSGGRDVRLPYVRPWIAALAALVVLFVGVAHLIWADRTSHTERLIARGVASQPL